MKKLTLLLAFLCCLIPGLAFAVNTAHDIHIEWSYDYQPAEGKTLAGYNLYKEGTKVCTTNTPEITTMDCVFESDPGIFNFTITSFFSDGTESAPSPPYNFTLDPEEPTLPSEGSHAFTFTWESDNTPQDVSSHRVYLNSALLCEATNPNVNEVTCTTDLLQVPMAFTVTTLFTDGSESAESNLLQFNPTDYAQFSATKLLSFAWEYPIEQTLAGFKIYKDNTLICETTNPLDRSLSCASEITESTVTFNITAVDTSGNETIISNTILYSSSDTPVSTELSADITTNTTEGAAPLTVAFDGASSTGEIKSFSWSFGDGAASNANNIDHTYLMAGTYTAQLTVSDGSGNSNASSVAITVTEGAPATTPPQAVISSSTALGQAPLIVSFNGNESTPKSEITLYQWDFGDGSSATGSVVSHSFNTAGTFNTSLTVTNNEGLTDSISTPILVTSPPIVENQSPQAVLSAAPTSGNLPLTVTFNGGSSSDSDGTISSYSWHFGDGTSASGISATHTYTSQASFTATLSITDNDGAQSSATTLITVNPEQALPEFNIELGEISVNSNWAHVEISTSFQNPIVIAGPPGSADPAPCVVRLRNITPTGFDIKITEWDYLDDSHANETISYIIMEKGHFTLPDGIQVEAGTFDGSTSFSQITFNTPFSLSPVVLSTIASYNEEDTISGRMRNISTTGFAYYYREQEKNSNTHTTEAVNFIAWELGSGSIETLLYEVLVTPNSVTHNDHAINFQSDFGTSPLLLADMQTTDGADTSNTRTDDLSATGVLVNIQEEQSNDDEVGHTTEVVGYLAFGSTENPVDSGSGDKLFTFTWDYDSGQDIVGYRFYLNNNLLCETNTPAAQSHSCKASMLNEVMTFTMTAIDSNGAETMPSSLLTFDPSQFSQLAPTKKAVFYWDFDQSEEINITGFAILVNNITVCESDNPAARELTCEIETPTEATSVSIQAIQADGTASDSANTIRYVP